MQNFTRKQNVVSIRACWLLTLCTCLLMLQASATVRRVKPGYFFSGTPTGATWATAYGNLQDAINASASGDELWLDGGVYNPAPGTGTSYFYFSMKSGVDIYGGFNGTETARGQRDIVNNPSATLVRRNSSNPVMYNNGVASTALLDGVRIEGSGLAAPISNYSSAGIDNDGTSFPTLNNIIFSNLKGNNGGALNIAGGNSAITNVTFENNSATGAGGAIYFNNCTSTLTNVVFKNNNSGAGGAVYSFESAPIYTNVIFEGNTCSQNGSAVLNDNSFSLSTKKPGFAQVLFIANKSTAGGAALHNILSQASVINCTFANNWVATSSSTGGIYNGGGSGIVTITNCLFYGNGYAANGNLVTPRDLSNVSGNTNAVTYSSFNEAGNYPNANNVGSIASPFIDISNPDGTDGKYFTADDGLRLSVCNASSAIDKGNNTATTLATDLAGQPRKFDVTLVPDGGSGTSPIIDMGAYEDQTTINQLSITGAISNAHTVPYPKELATDNITNVQSPTVGGTITYSWQQSTNGTTWTTIPGATSATYNIPSISQTTDFRRGVATTQFCNTPYYSNVVTISVVQPNGVIEGRVTSSNGAPVQGITITAQRLTAVESGPANYSYPAVLTGPDGRYTINNVYYGTTTSGATVRITPSKQAHNFNFAFLDRTLTPNTPQRTDVDFIDNTVTSIVGLTFQQCTDCLLTSGTIGTQNCPIDSILIYKGPNASSLTYATTSGYINPDYGRYALTVSDPSTIVIEPRLTGHTFSPANRSVTPTDNLSGIDFRDVTTHTITGKISAGCNNYIGNAVLEFTDVLPNAQDGSPRTSCFRKRVTTTGTGNYSITLPARKYSVRVISFTPAFASTNPSYVAEADLLSFINTKLPKDSLTRDISTSNATLNLVYQRSPVIVITSGLNIICSNPTPFALVRQAAADSFRVFAYQGPSSLGCPVSDTSTKIRIATNVQKEDQMEDLYYAVADTGTRVRLVGGTPNITGNHLKDLNIYFTDKYGRVASTFNRKVLVTGVKADAATFTTVSPEVPLVVLHDPPGDGSYSTWESNHSITNTTRFYAAKGQSIEGWVEAKIGAKLIVGLGVATEISAWGTIRGSIEVGSQSTSSNEAVITTTTSQEFSTSDNPGVTGSGGDVYVGAALNLIYAVSTEIGYTGCGNITSGRKLMVANNGFATQYVYTEDFILNTLIPNLQELARLAPPDSAGKYLNQLKVWQQVVDNNTENKRRAAFDVNRSFSGQTSATYSTTTSSTKSSTIEFSTEINPGVAAELGFETGGSGLSGGVNVNFKMETGSSESNEVTDETTIAYTLKDDDAGDRFSVNVKKDPVYNTPVFELVAGTTSCPPEPGTQPRFDVYLTALNPVVQNVPAGDYANFTLKIVNTSQSNEARTYRLFYDQSSNVANETITIAGSPWQSNAPYSFPQLAYLDSATVVVSIKRLPGSSVFSYEGIRFNIQDNCANSASKVLKSVQLSAYFVSSCSSIALTQPADGWQLNAAGNNQIFIKPSGYDVATLTSVNLQYATGTGSNWADGPFITTAQLASGFNFDASTLPEGATSLRLRLDCNSGTVYSPRSTGIIDRRAPQLYGRPNPTDDNYVNGDIIGFTYNESLNTNGATIQVTVRRLSNGQLIPATAGISDNKVIITPTSSITGFNGDSIRVIISGISDVNGNVRTKADTTRFIVGTTVAGTGNQALTVSRTNPTVYKNGDSTINVFFNLPANAVNDTRVNYTLSGTARYGIDYTITYSNAGALYAGFNGSTGSIGIASGTNQAVLRIKPIGGDTAWSPDKTVIISLTEGGDYSLGATTVVTGIITSEDGVTIYTFTGDGAWNIKNNWLDGKMPLSQLIAPKEIIINPSGTCVLNVAQTIRPGAKVTVKQNRRFVIQGSLKQQ